MRRIILALIFMLSTGSALAGGVLPEHSGAWYNSDQSGHGISIEILSSERAIAFWYAFDPQGNPMWLYIDGAIAGNTIFGEAYFLKGMVWGDFDPSDKNMFDWGTVDIEFSGCHHATVTWDSVFPGYGSGQLELERLTSICGQRCFDTISTTAGYWDVTWIDVISEASRQGNAIVDDAGLVTIQFPEAHLIGALAPFESPDSALKLDARLDLGPWTDARELSLVGTPTVNGFQFRSDTDLFEFKVDPGRPVVPVTQEYLDGEWLLIDQEAGAFWPLRVEMIDGRFEWDGMFIHYLVNTVVQFYMPAHGGGVIPITVTSQPWPGETFSGHAFYWQDPASGWEYIEFRWVWGREILNVGIITREIP